MPRTSVCLGAAAVLSLSLVPLAAAPPDVSSRTDPRVERGRYLAEQVAMCVECHSPRDESGNLLRGELFHGAPVPFRSPFPKQVWALRAPSIAGMNGYTDDAGVRLLTEGIARTGKPPQSPMPRFRMTTEDAQAVVAFLKSIP